MGKIRCLTISVVSLPLLVVVHPTRGDGQIPEVVVMANVYMKEKCDEMVPTSRPQLEKAYAEWRARNARYIDSLQSKSDYPVTLEAARKALNKRTSPASPAQWAEACGKFLESLNED